MKRAADMKPDYFGKIRNRTNKIIYFLAWSNT